MHKLDSNLAIEYTSKSQQIRVMSEAWTWEYMYCPNCGNTLSSSVNNNPVGDFVCTMCTEEYELKSKANVFGRKMNDGAYGTMIQRLTSTTNPSFFWLNYTKNLDIVNFFVIPKFYFTPDIIEKRKPLSSTARRAGWIWCNILLESIPNSGKIYYIENGKERDKGYVLDDWRKINFLDTQVHIESKWWLLDVMRCVDMLEREFRLDDIYRHIDMLKLKYPDNNNIEAKIRQQLQILRDNGYISFLGRGKYVRL